MDTTASTDDHRPAARSRWGVAALTTLVLSAGFVLVPASPADARPVAWSTTVLDTGADGAWDVTAADLDGDGDLDLASAGAIDNTIAWYRNDGGGAWTATDIATTAQDARSVTAADLDGDGDLDLASASSDDDTIAWYENTAGDGSAWIATDIATTARGATFVVAADLDGDGDVDLASSSSGDDVIAWYRNDGGGAWTATDIVTNADGATSVVAADLDGDGDLDLASASAMDDTIAWYENTAGDGSAWTATDIATSANSAQSVTAADLDGDGDVDLASASYQDDIIAWYRNDGGGAWTATSIATTANGATAVVAADLDGDGDLDLASASNIDDTVAWYRNEGGGAWTATNIATNADGSYAVVAAAADVDGDGDLDLASASPFDDTIAWYENETIHRGAAGWEATVVVPDDDGAYDVAVGDLDGDGDLDLATFVASGIACYRNDGGAWPATAVTATVAQYTSIVLADVDGDGDLDVASASRDDDTIAWYENTAGDGAAWTRHVVAASAEGAYAVIAADLDGDGDLDLASASALDDTVAWYRNDGGGAWPATDVTTSADGAQSVVAADLDGDGDLDLASASSNDDTVAWYRNDGGVFVVMPAVTATALGARWVIAADLDGDGDVDLVSASRDDDTIAWHRNDGAGAFTAQPVVTTTVDRPEWVIAADLDGDGDLDLATVGSLDHMITWYQNGGDGGAWTAAGVATTEGARTVVVGDLDGDGDLDLASANGIGADEAVTWYRNDGTQLGVATTASGPATLASGQADDVLAVTVTHQGRAGDRDAQLTTLGVRLEEADADPLSPGEAEAVIDTLRVHRDDGDGVLDAGDTEVASVTTLAVDGAGDLTVAIADVADAAIAFGTPATYLVTVTFTADAHLQTPDTVLLTHRSAATTAKDGVSAPVIPLTLPATVTAANQLTALNTAPTADAGGPYTVQSGATVTLDGTASTDPQQAGTALSYAWDLDDDSAYDDASGANPDFDTTGFGTVGANTVRLRVTDDGGLTATSAATVTITPAPVGPGGSPSTTIPAAEVVRVAGADRYATAAMLADRLEPGIDVVYVTTGEAFADALAAGPAAAAAGTGLLLVEPDSIPDATRAALERLRPGSIILVGGTTAIGHEVETALAALTTGAVTRIAGADRYQTAIQLSQLAFPDPVDTVHLTTGGGYADAVTAGPSAGTAGPVLPIGESISADLAAELTRLAPATIVLAGGADAISPEIEATLAELLPDTTVVRVAGATRYDTAVGLALLRTDPDDVTIVYLTTGSGYADALAATPNAIHDGAPVLLIAADGTIPPSVLDYLDTIRADTVIIIGGTDAVPDAVVGQLTG